MGLPGLRAARLPDVAVKGIALLYTLAAIVALLYPVVWVIGSALKDDYNIRMDGLNLLPLIPKEVYVRLDFGPSYAALGTGETTLEALDLDLRKEVAFTALQLGLAMDRDSYYAMRVDAVADGRLLMSLRVPKYVTMHITGRVITHHGRRLLVPRIDAAWDTVSAYLHFSDYLEEPRPDPGIARYRPFSDRAVVDGAFASAGLPLRATVGEVLSAPAPLHLLDNIFGAVLRFSGIAGPSERPQYGIERYTLNTFLITGAAIVGALSINGLAGYALAMLLGRKASQRIMLYFTTTMMIPGMLTIVPYYLLFTRLGLINTYWALLVPAFLGASPFWIYLFKGFFGGIPRDFFDAAAIDGAGEGRILVSVCVPLSKPIISVLVMNVFIGVWNDFFWPFLAVRDNKFFTIPLMLYKYRLPGEGVAASMNTVMAMYALIAIPCLLVVLLFNRYIERGIVFTGLKG